tara:strand:+ start:952 stop:1881 length:930 start_codon:yes stop_codon:yes gene_type:complete
MMSILVVGSIALDSIETPFGKADGVVGGSAVFFSAAASMLCPVKVVSVVGDDYPMEELNFLVDRKVDLSGVICAPGESFFWSGRYSYDLSSRETLETRLGVLSNFKPIISDEFKNSRIVFLGNIDPVLQLDVIDQVGSPEIVACDTMDHWIKGKRKTLIKLLERVDILIVNDSEVREFSGEYNLIRAAHWIQERGPKIVVVKKGEHGAMFFGPKSMFLVPGFPLDAVSDPTGAGDSFAGGFLGHLASVRSPDINDYKMAMVYGSIMGSFAVESFSVKRFRELQHIEVTKRIMALREMAEFGHQTRESHA